MFKRNRRRVPALNTTSTADISFMLLIFFLVTSSMDSEKGLLRLLPPPPETEEHQEMPVKERNVLQISLTAAGKTVAGGDTLSLPDLRQRIELFVANAKGDPSLPEMSSREVHLLGRCHVSDHHILALNVSPEATYDSYYQLQNTIVMAYARLRNGVAKRRFGHPYAECNADERAALAIVYPQRISEENIE